MNFNPSTLEKTKVITTWQHKKTRLKSENRKLERDGQDPKGIVKVLLVEDLDVQGLLLQKLLHQPNQRPLEFEVIRTETLTASQEKLKGESFHGILLDLNLPDSRGLDTFLRLKEQVPHLPILILTGVYDGELKLARKCLQQGAQDYLSKQDILQHPDIGQEMLVRSLCYAIERQKIEAQIKQQTAELAASNQQLEQEIKESQSIEENLEMLVRERTTALELANESLKREIEVRQGAEEALQESNQLLQIISKAQSQFIADESLQILFDNLLENLLQLTESQYGFIGEIHYDENNQPSGADGYLKIRGKPYLKTHAITDISWNEETRKFYQEHAPKGMEFYNFKTLFGAVIVTGKPVIANNPQTDTCIGDLPSGHPPLNAFLGLPLYSNQKFVGIVGIANRPGGYDEQLVEYLQPFLSTCGNIIQAHHSEQGRQQAEAELRHKAEELLLITDNLPAWIAYIDKNKRYRFCNQKYQELLGLSLAEIVGQSILSVRENMNYEKLKNYLDQALGGEKIDLERKIRAADGKEYHTLFRMVPHLEEEEVRGCFIIVLDISDRLKAEHSLKQLNQELENRVKERTALLQQSQEQLQDLFDNANDLIHAVSLEDGSFLYVNHAWREVLGYEEEEISQLYVFDIIHPRPSSEILVLIVPVEAGENRSQRESRSTVFNQRRSVHCGGREY